jgi:hypothetical protein
MNTMPTVATQTTTSVPAIFSAERYLSLASTIDKDEGKAIFRRFGDLNMLNLLSLQAELEHLRMEFKAICVKKSHAEQINQGYLATYSLAIQQDQKEAEEIVATRDKRRLELQGQIREKLKEYSKCGVIPTMGMCEVSDRHLDSALLEGVQLRSLEPAEHGDIKYLRAWLRPEIGGSGLEDSDRSCWDAEHDDDLISLKSQMQKGNTFILGIKLALYIIYYELWGYRKVSPQGVLCPGNLRN